MGTGFFKFVTKSDAFLIPDLTQNYYDKMTINLRMEPDYIINELGVDFKSELNFTENIETIVEEYKKSRHLRPIRILLHGPPASGKTLIAQKLAEHYNLHYVSVKTLIDETIENLQSKIDYYKEQLREKEKRKEEAEEKGEAEDEDLEDDDDEDIEEILNEQTEKLKEVIIA